MFPRHDLAGTQPAPLLPSASQAPQNPLFEGADPDVLVWGGRTWLYLTSQVRPSEPLFHVHSSADLITWQKHGPILDLRSVGWVPEDGRRHHCAWAPGIFQHGGSFYLYYSVGPQHAQPSRIGVAVASHPAGPFVDSGRPLVAGDDRFEAIDAMVFRDPVSGRVFLYCGGSAGAKLRVFELGADLVSFAREWEVQTPQAFTEAAHMHYRNSVYYLSYSSGFFGDHTYSVHYSTAASPVGPWTYRGCLLWSNEEHWGPGHHCFLEDPASGLTHVFYHRWHGAGRTGKRPRHRSVCMDRLHYALDGAILPVRMS